ncbi:MAG TPA: hypothetical protein VFT16_02745 [Candidatus Saccharimonadales bacterium]|nr:hypothetical protein [Candidatus Saccharimonadales bacterium]
MTETLNTTVKQAGLEIINMSAAHADEMETWADVLARNPDSVTATFSAGFVSRPSERSRFEFVVDVQAPPNQETILRTWAIETKVGDDQKEYFNNIQLTFVVNGEQAHNLITRGKAFGREDVRILLQDEATRLSRITISNDFGDDATKQMHGERYDFTAAELDQSPENTAKVSRTLQMILQAFAPDSTS